MKIDVQTLAGKPFTVDWENWQPVDRAVLCFIRENGSLLMIHKKTGLGAGLFNAPGGRIEPGETPEQAAIRETREEIGVTPYRLHEAGILRFQFVDGHSIHGHVFIAGGYTGRPIETVEAAPLWIKETEIPYIQMWADDRVWLPLLLQNRYFDTHFIFDNEVMLWHILRVK